MKAPFIWFGGKRKIAPEVWAALGDVELFGGFSMRCTNFCFCFVGMMPTARGRANFSFMFFTQCSALLGLRKFLSVFFGELFALSLFTQFLFCFFGHRATPGCGNFLARFRGMLPSFTTSHFSAGFVGVFVSLFCCANFCSCFGRDWVSYFSNASLLDGFQCLLATFFRRCHLSTRCVAKYKTNYPFAAFRGVCQICSICKKVCNPFLLCIRPVSATCFQAHDYRTEIQSDEKIDPVGLVCGLKFRFANVIKQAFSQIKSPAYIPYCAITGIN